MSKVAIAIGASAIVLLALTAWALCAVGDALETFEDPCHWKDEE